MSDLALPCHSHYLTAPAFLLLLLIIIIKITTVVAVVILLLLAVIPRLWCPFGILKPYLFAI